MSRTHIIPPPLIGEPCTRLAPRRTETCMRTFMMSVTLALSVASSATAEPNILRCGRILDVQTGKVASNQVIVIDAGRIAEVRAATPQDRGVDLTSLTCLPGLIDAHTHLMTDLRARGYQGLGVSQPRQTLAGAKNALVTLNAG